MKKRLCIGAGLAVLSLALGGCGFATDAATRLANDVTEGAHELRRSGGAEAQIVHQPRSFPEGCSGPYRVVFQESLHHPVSGGSLLVGCIGSGTFGRRDYGYGTTYHLNAVRVPTELALDKPAGADLVVTLRKSGEQVEVTRLK